MEKEDADFEALLAEQESFFQSGMKPAAQCKRVGAQKAKKSKFMEQAARDASNVTSSRATTDQESGEKFSVGKWMTPLEAFLSSC